MTVRTEHSTIELSYYLKAQIIPIDVDKVLNANGKSMLRARRKKVLLSPERPTIQAPAFDNEIIL